MSADLWLALGALLLAVASYTGGILARDAATAVRVWLTRRQLRAECLAYHLEQRAKDADAEWAAIWRVVDDVLPPAEEVDPCADFIFQAMCFDRWEREAAR